MPMIIEEAAGFLEACMSGAVIYLAYQILCLFRKITAHSRLAVDAEDLIYWILASGYLFYHIYKATYGRIRWYFAVGTALGAALAKFIFFCGKTLYIKIQKSLEKRAEKR